MKALKIVACALAVAATWAPAAQQTIRQTDSVRQMVAKLNANFTEIYSGVSLHIPYVGATNDVDLGVYSITARGLYISRVQAASVDTVRVQPLVDLFVAETIGRDLVLRGGNGETPALGGPAIPAGNLILGGGRHVSPGVVLLDSALDAGGNMITNAGVVAASNGAALVLTGASVLVTAPLVLLRTADAGGNNITNVAKVGSWLGSAGESSIDFSTPGRLAAECDLYVHGSGNEFWLKDRGDGVRALYLGGGLHMQPHDTADIDVGSNDVLAVKTLAFTNGSVISGDKTSTTLGVVSTNTVYLVGVDGVDEDYDGRYEYVPATGIYTFEGGFGNEIHIDDLGVDGMVWQLYYQDMAPEPSGIWCPVEDFPAGPWWNSNTEEELGTAYFGTNGFTVADDTASTRRLRLNGVTFTNDSIPPIIFEARGDRLEMYTGELSQLLTLDPVARVVQIGDIGNEAGGGYLSIGGGVIEVFEDVNLQDNDILNVHNIGTPEDPVAEVYISDGSIYLGSAKIAGSNGGISVTSTNDPGNTNGVTMGSNGIFAVGTATWFEDLMLSGFEFVDPAGVGGVEKVQVTNFLYGAEFSPNEWGNGILQLKHQYKAQSTVYPHLHTASTNTVRATTNTWFMGMTSGRIGVQFTNHYSATVTVTNQPGVWHAMPQFPSWTTNMAESTVIGVVVSNLGPDTAILVDADIHIEGEKLGTDNVIPANP